MTDTSGESVPLPTLPDVDRAWSLLEDAYDEGITVLGWADDSVVTGYGDRLTFDVTKKVQRSHEDEVLIIAIRVPHPDEMSLGEVVLGCPCCDLDGTHHHERCLHPCCPVEGDTSGGGEGASDGR